MKFLYGNLELENILDGWLYNIRMFYKIFFNSRFPFDSQAAELRRSQKHHNIDSKIAVKYKTLWCFIVSIQTDQMDGDQMDGDGRTTYHAIPMSRHRNVKWKKRKFWFNCSNWNEIFQVSNFNEKKRINFSDILWTRKSVSLKSADYLLSL